MSSIRTLLLGPSSAAPGAAPDGAVRTASLVPLARADLVPEATGCEAVRLAELMRAGIGVPIGFVVADSLGARLDARPTESLERVLDDTGRRELDALWASLGTARVTVRGLGRRWARRRHGPSRHGRIGMGRRARRARRCGARGAPFATRRRSSRRRCPGHGRCRGGAGDARRPLRGHPVHRAPGDDRGDARGDRDASGRGDRGRRHHGRRTHLRQAHRFALGPSREAPPALDLSPLVALGREIETLLGRPQVIEWAFADGCFHVLGVRGIAALVVHRGHP